MILQDNYEDDSAGSFNVLTRKAAVDGSFIQKSTNIRKSAMLLLALI